MQPALGSTQSLRMLQPCWRPHAGAYLWKPSRTCREEGRRGEMEGRKEEEAFQRVRAGAHRRHPSFNSFAPLVGLQYCGGRRTRRRRRSPQARRTRRRRASSSQFTAAHAGRPCGDRASRDTRADAHEFVEGGHLRRRRASKRCEANCAELRRVRGGARRSARPARGSVVMRLNLLEVVPAVVATIAQRGTLSVVHLVAAVVAQRVGGRQHRLFVVARGSHPPPPPRAHGSSAAGVMAARQSFASEPPAAARRRAA